MANASDLDDILGEEFDDDPPTGHDDLANGRAVEPCDSYERLLLAAAYRDPSLVHMAAGEFVFGEPAHEAVIMAMLRCVHTRAPITEGNIARALRAVDRLDLVGGCAGLRELLHGAPEEEVDRALLDLRIARDALPPVAAEFVVVLAVDVLEAEAVDSDHVGGGWDVRARPVG